MLFYLTRNELDRWFSKCGPRGLTRGSAKLFLSSYYKIEGKNVLNILNILQNLLIWNNGITDILDSKLRTGIYASYTVGSRPFLWLND
jgi:hypothetical protein